MQRFKALLAPKTFTEWLLHISEPGTEVYVEQAKAIILSLSTFLGKRAFAWLAAVCASIGASDVPYSEAQVTAFIAAGLSLAADAFVYWLRHRKVKKVRRKNRG